MAPAHPQVHAILAMLDSGTTPEPVKVVMPLAVETALTLTEHAMRALTQTEPLNLLAADANASKPTFISQLQPV